MEEQQKQILITGGTGFIGTALTPVLVNLGYNLWIYTRTPDKHPPSNSVHYIDNLSLLDDVHIDAVINLAGEPLAAKRWTSSRKEEFVRSRVKTTQQLYHHLSKNWDVPDVVISGSAIGYYGACKDEKLDESSPPGTGFAADLCKQWEAEAHSFHQLNTRLCITRIGVVLGPNGGAFREMRRSFDLKVASQIGNGQQWLSWIHLEDMVRSIIFLLQNNEVNGLFNCTAPKPVTNEDFTYELGKQMGSIINLPMPDLAMQMLVGEMAKELLLVGQRVIPERLSKLGFSFKYPSLSSALKIFSMNIKTGRLQNYEKFLSHRTHC